MYHPNGCSSPPSDTFEKPKLHGFYSCFYDLPSWVIGQLEAQLTEHFCFVVGVRVMQDSGDVGEPVDDSLDLCLAHPYARRR
jgi:hypothetical protein